MTKRTYDEVGFTVGSGNVFRDLGLESPDEELSKARLARQIHDRAVALACVSAKTVCELTTSLLEFTRAPAGTA